MFHGSLVAIVTPMRDNGDVDFDAWARLLDFHLENGTDGIVVGGTTGESPTITEAELRELTERACAHVKKRIPIIVGAGTSSTASTVARTRWLSELPIDALLVVTPAYNRPPPGRPVQALRGGSGSLSCARHPLQHPEPHGCGSVAGYGGEAYAFSADRRGEGRRGWSRACA